MRKIKTRRALLRWTVVIGVSVALFAFGREAALRERGYAAIGGEYLLLLLPAVVYILGRSVASIVREFRQLYDEAPEE